jgi:hypothetical protein
MSIESAERIVELAGAMGDRALSPAARANLFAEQKRLWDRDFPATPYERIAHDVWLVRSYG